MLRIVLAAIARVAGVAFVTGAVGAAANDLLLNQLGLWCAWQPTARR